MAWARGGSETERGRQGHRKVTKKSIASEVLWTLLVFSVFFQLLFLYSRSFLCCSCPSGRGWGQTLDTQENACEWPRPNDPLSCCCGRRPKLSSLLILPWSYTTKLKKVTGRCSCSRPPVPLCLLPQESGNSRRAGSPEPSSLCIWLAWPLRALRLHHLIDQTN